MESITQPKGFLRVYGVNVVDGDGRKVILKGVCFEKRIFDGSTTNQCPTRRLLGALLDVLGQEKYDYFFEKVLAFSPSGTSLTRPVDSLRPVPRLFLHSLGC